ncbi:MAG: NAD(P)H-binding protein [Myxococcota bacterium]
MPTSRRPSLRVLVVGATGYIGRHAVAECIGRGHHVVCLARSKSGVGGKATQADTRSLLRGAEIRFGEVSDPGSLAQALRGERFDAVVSCLASRSGGIDDAWNIEHRAQLAVLDLARSAGATQFVLLSAICVQRPKLAFQHAKLAFEEALKASGLAYSIVRPTAFFKSLSGQVRRVKDGRPFMVFGDGELTACKPISEADVARFIADCLVDDDKSNAVLPIGGPGDAITPRGQGELLFRLCGREPRFRRIPVAMFDLAAGVLGPLGRVSRRARDKAEFARIGRYYATESMLVYDAAGERYDADATPAYGQDTLEAFYARALSDGLAGQELGDHALF